MLYIIYYCKAVSMVSKGSETRPFTVLNLVPIEVQTKNYRPYQKSSANRMSNRQNQFPSRNNPCSDKIGNKSTQRAQLPPKAVIFFHHNIFI